MEGKTRFVKRERKETMARDYYQFNQYLTLTLLTFFSSTNIFFFKVVVNLIAVSCD